MNDDVRLLIAGTELRPKSYEIQRDVFTQPCAFSFTLGEAELTTDLINRVHANDPFELRINETLVFTGRVDGFSSQADGNRGTEVTFRGRDMMTVLLGACATSEETFTDITYAELAEHALRAVLGPNVPFTLVYTNDANRKAVTAAKTPTSNRTADQRALGKEILIGAVQGGLGQPTSSGTPAPASATVSQPPSRKIKVELGEAWYQGVLKPEFDRAGLTMMATADGNYYLGAPDTTQSTSGRLVRRTNTDDDTSITNILGHDFRLETTSRHSSYTVHFRSGGGKTSRVNGDGSIEDAEMKAFGINRPWVGKDEKIKTAAQADQYVKRKMCDERRASFHLVYRVAGHTTTGANGEEILWAPETVVDVDDDELDLHRKMYVESVRMIGFPQITELKVCRLQDILNATPEEGFIGE